MDDMAIQGKTKSTINKAFNALESALNRKKMEINISKFQYLTTDQSEIISSQKSGEDVPTGSFTKYLGQEIGPTG